MLHFLTKVGGTYTQDFIYFLKPFASIYLVGTCIPG